MCVSVDPGIVSLMSSVWWDVGRVGSAEFQSASERGRGNVGMRIKP